jgi:hypothetical protein
MAKYLKLKWLGAWPTSRKPLPQSFRASLSSLSAAAHTYESEAEDKDFSNH